MRQQSRTANPGGNETGWMVAGGVLVVFAAGMLVYWLSAIAGGVGEKVGSNNPASILLAQLKGQAAWSGVQILVLIVGLLIVVGVAILLLVAARRQGGGRRRMDNRARAMTSAREYSELTEARAVADARRLGADKAGPGVPLGKLVNNRRMLFASWEWVQVWICGPRAGKTSCVVIPQIMETTGPVVATSNKRDIVDMTRGPRSRLGRVWVYDVQRIIGEGADWYWNPLTFATDMERAQRLVDVFRSANTSADSREDAYFGPAAKELLSLYIFAAAVGERPITDVHRWVNDETNFSAVTLLRESGNYEYAESLERIQTLTDRQRDGLYGQVRTWIGILGDPKIIPWVRADANPARVEFHPEQFVRSTDTIYLISREGGGSARALTAALAMAVMTAAEEYATYQPGGRLATPLMAVLDEAANVVRWPELPDLYSHYGSRGIIVSTFFQNHKQGVEAFGENGFAKLWSAANVRVVGSGLSEQFLEFISTAIGDRRVQTSSTNTGKGLFDTSHGRSTERERIFDVSDLTSLPMGRAILSTSGHPSALMELDHYSKKPYAGDISASNNYYRDLAVKQGADLHE